MGGMGINDFEGTVMDGMMKTTGVGTGMQLSVVVLLGML